MTIEKAIQQIDDIITAFDAEMMKLSEEIATNAIALIRRRIQKEGIGETYSPKTIDAKLYMYGLDRLDTEKTKNFVRSKAKLEDPDDRQINWADIRRAHGNQTQFVDLTFTGRMFQNIGIVATEKNGTIYTTIIAGMTQEARDKLKWNTENYGEFFKTNSAENKMLNEIIGNRINDFIKTHLHE